MEAQGARNTLTTVNSADNAIDVRSTCGVSKQERFDPTEKSPTPTILPPIFIFQVNISLRHKNRDRLGSPTLKFTMQKHRFHLLKGVLRSENPCRRHCKNAILTHLPGTEATKAHNLMNDESIYRWLQSPNTFLLDEFLSIKD